MGSLLTHPFPLCCFFVAAPLLEHTLGEVKYLTKHPHYHPHNPNNIYSLIGSFVLGNQVCTPSTLPQIRDGG